MTVTASIVGSTFVTVMMDGVTHTITDDHDNYAAIREALKLKDYQLIERLINVKQTLINYVQGTVSIKGDRVFYGDMEVKGSVVDRILQMVRENFDAQPMMRFLANLMANPSKRAVDELYGFLEATKLPITDDGCFLAYKKVNHDYRDFYTGRMDNSVGQVLEMPRNQVDDNKDRTCSEGLHFCSLSYLPHYHGGSGRVVIVKINPADVVSIPSDYNNAKGRAWRYEVVGEHEGDDRESKDYFDAPVYTAQVNNVAPVAPVAPVGPAANTTDPSLSPALAGYDRGRRDAIDRFEFNDKDARFYGNDAVRYAEAYASGYDSVAKPLESEDEEDDAYDRGYAAGEAKAEVDSDNAKGYDDTPPAGESAAFNSGFEDGYHDSYNVDWGDVGHERAFADAEANRPYDDTPPVGSDENHYRIGYADGWRDAKVSRI